MEWKINESTMPTIAEAILSELYKRKPEHGATIVFLVGELGSGKTTLTKYIGKILGITEEIVSPTYVIMKSYPLSHTVWSSLVHIDAYRLLSFHDTKVLNLDTLMSQNNLIFIEWPEIISDTSLVPHAKIMLEHASNETRSIRFT